MKRMTALMILLCLLLCACTPEAAPTNPSQPTPSTQAPTTVPNETTVPTSPTQASTEPTQPSTEPVTQGKVTVYLLENTNLYDSGYTEYIYDSSNNIFAYKVFSIERQLMYTVYFEQPDANGMPTVCRADWGDGTTDTRNLAWHPNGKIQQEQYDPGFSGYQYDYDPAGNVIEKREYFDGILQSCVYYDYNGQQLQKIFSMDAEGNTLFVCVMENGHVAERICYDMDGTYAYSYYYTYDENGNILQETMNYDGTQIPSQTFTYRAVEVDAALAPYLINQQQYLLPLH